MTARYVNMPSLSKRGFSLVELSIVLVILGLLVGGVLTGQSLIHAAQLRSISTEALQFKSAAHTFQEKYFHLPGDMPNARDFWPTMPNRGNNGDGNGRINESSGTGDAANEGRKAWQHLMLAGLVTGVTNNGGVAGEEGSEPASKFGSSNYWGMYFERIYSNNIALPARLEANVVTLGNGSSAYTPFNGTSARYGVLKAEEAYNIDTKLDDGKPDNGFIFAHRGDSQTGCVSDQVWATSVNFILTDNTNRTCKIVFRLQ